MSLWEFLVSVVLPSNLVLLFLDFKQLLSFGTLVSSLLATLLRVFQSFS